MNAKKCELIRHSSVSECSSADPPGIPDVPVIMDNWSILGSPIGSSKFCSAFVEKAVFHKVDEAATLCLSLEDPQLAFSVVRKCVSYCRGVYMSRTCSPRHIREVLAASDKVVFNAFEKIACFTPTYLQWQQATLSTSRGGLGLRSSAAHASAAYFASVNACAEADGWDPQSSEDFDYVIDDIRSLIDQPCWGFDGSFQEVSQHDISAALDDTQFDLLLSASSMQDCARVNSCASQGVAAAWLTATPSPYLGTAFTAACFITALKMWLGAAVCSEGPCPRCGKPMDTGGYHALTCNI